MSGGAGSRLWPLSTRRAPKQFHALQDGGTLIQETAIRTRSSGDLQFNPPIIVCNESHVATAQEQLRAIGVEPALVIAEPFGRNTAAVAALAAQVVQRLSPGSVILLMPADHIIGDLEAFQRAVRLATTGAEDGRIVTFGIQPSRAETGYGYIQAGTLISTGLHEIGGFHEKPTSKVAEDFLQSGHYLWNGGIFAFRPEVMIEEVARWLPELGAAAGAVLSAATTECDVLYLPQTEMAACPSVSIDVAVMEQTSRGAVVPVDMRWADVGSWSEVWRLAEKDAEGNVSRGPVRLIDSRDCLVWSETTPVAIIGMTGVSVVATAEGLLVLPTELAQRAREAADAFSEPAP